MLGSGTSHGVPMIGCECATCRSTDPARSRARGASVLHSDRRRTVGADRHDHRSCARRRSRTTCTRVDAILYTHSHADHVMGLDEVRRFNVLQKSAIPCYGDERTLRDLRRIYSYIFDPDDAARRRHAAGRAVRASAGEFCIGPATFVPVPLMHGSRRILGYRIGSFAYLTDCSAIPGRVVAAADAACRRVILDALRERPHPTHLSLSRGARASSSGWRRQRAYFTHMCHDLPHAATCARLPAGVELAYDGLAFEIDLVMQVIHYPDDPRPPRWHQPVLALGNFDGMHRGHLKIIERVRRGADERGATAMAMTFDPASVEDRQARQSAAAADDQSAEARGVDRAGMHGVAIVRFTPELALWDPETFVRTVLVEWLHVAEVWVGANFLFGHDRAGNFSMLRSLGARYGFRAEKIDPVRYKDFVVSSTRIRRLVSEGRVDEAGALLGHHYAIDGSVVHGQQRGRGLGFPTANLCTENELIPPRGVYATTATLDGVVVSVDHEYRQAADVRERRRERHRDPRARFRQGPLRRELRLGFVQRLRDEKRFDGVEALKTQIEADRGAARASLFDRMGLSRCVLYNTLDPHGRRVRALAGQPRPHVRVRPDGVQPRAYRQLPDLRRGRCASADVEVPEGLQGAATS